MNIYLVVAQAEYEHSINVRAFSLKKMATAFAKDCNAYLLTAPVLSDLETNNPKWERAYQRYTQAMKKWVAGHPTPDHARFDSYIVETIEFIK